MDDEIFKISKDRERAADLVTMARERLEMLYLVPKDRPYKLVEEYYEIVKELLTAIMYADGYKTLSHISLIKYFSDNYSALNDEETRLVDTLRRLRNSILYYGKKVSSDFLVNHEETTKHVIDKVMEIAIKNVKESN